MKQKLLLFFFAFLSVNFAKAQTFTYNGINYNITDTTNFKVEVGNNCISGAANIPETVVYNSQNYDVTTIGNSAFQNCTGLTSVTIPNSVTTIGTFAFYNCTGLTSVIILDAVTIIGNNAFRNCSVLTSVSIGNSVTNIESFAFANCIGLTSVIIPNSVTTIGQLAFDRCTALATVTIGSSVATIDSGVFFDCTNLTTVNCYVQNPIVINANVFGGTTNQVGCALNVPIGREAAYEAAAVWTNFNPINGVLATDSFMKNSFSMYPNPSNGVFTIDLEEDATIFVNDLLGKVIYTNKVKAGNNTIDISNYQSGIYLLNISNGNGSVTKKIIKE